MTEEKAKEYQYSNALGGIVRDFMELHTVNIDRYPTTDRDDQYISDAFMDAVKIIGRVKQVDRALVGTALLEKVLEESLRDVSCQGTASQILLAMLDCDYKGTDQFRDSASPVYTGLTQEVWDENLMTPKNPTFREGQTDLPVNLQVRAIIDRAIIGDKDYHAAKASTTVNLKDVRGASERQLHAQKKDWYQQLSNRMQLKTPVQPSARPLL